MFLPFTLAASGVVILYCNAAVLRTARRNMTTAFPRPVIAGCFYAKYSDSELLTNERTLKSVADELSEQGSPPVGEQSLCDSNSNFIEAFYCVET